MFSRIAVLAAALAGWVFLSCGNAAAVTITNQSTSYLPPIPVADNFPPSFMSPGTLYDHVTCCAAPFTDSIANVYRSPYQNLDTSMPAAYVGQPYSSVRVGSVGYNFAGGANTLSLLWGSPDSYNTLSFYSGLNGQGTLLGSFTGLDLAATLGLGHDYVTFFSSVAFLSVVLSTTIPAFEYAALSASMASSEVPLPPAVLLFGSAVVALEVLRRRRRNRTKETAAA
jgi:hypothetical protein